MKYYWYVTHNYKKIGGVSGFGALAMDTGENWFPIRLASEYILTLIGADTVVIASWKRMSNRQYEEFLKDE